ncbi:MAG: phosphate-starvation-inducible PsiE family protein [Pseudomonadales bacterium]
MSRERLHDELSTQHEDRMIRFLHLVIRVCVRILAAIMVLVIMWGVADVVYVIIQKILAAPLGMLTVSDIFQLFGAFLVVLIAIEIFVNIRMYLGTNALPVQLVIATALMAIARKVIVLDFEQTDAPYILAIAAVVAALGATHWLLSRDNPQVTEANPFMPSAGTSRSQPSP